MNTLIAMLMGIFTVVELNCENLFDFRPDSLNPNKEWRSDSYRHWTPYRYWTKLTHISLKSTSTYHQLTGQSTPANLIYATNARHNLSKCESISIATLAKSVVVVAI